MNERILLSNSDRRSLRALIRSKKYVFQVNNVISLTQTVEIELNLIEGKWNLIIHLSFTSQQWHTNDKINHFSRARETKILIWMYRFLCLRTWFIIQPSIPSLRREANEQFIFSISFNLRLMSLRLTLRI